MFDRSLRGNWSSLPVRRVDLAAPYMSVALISHEQVGEMPEAPYSQRTRFGAARESNRGRFVQEPAQMAVSASGYVSIIIDSPDW